MSKLTHQMSSLQNRIQCTSQQQVFDQLSKIMQSTGIYVKNVGDMLKTSFTDHLKYNLHEGDTFRDLFTTRDSLFQAWKKADNNLTEKKDKLFRLKDTTKWGGFKDNQQMLLVREEVLKDRDMAFDFMLPKETAELEVKKQELCFFTNQCWDEIRRVSMDNGTLLFEHFKEMGMIHCSQISHVSNHYF